MSFLAHPISQAILADLWMGGLRMRKNPVFKIILGLLFPPSIMKLEFKTREELELMPQTEEELQDRDDSNSNSSGSSTASSRRSSIHGGSSVPPPMTFPPPPIIDIDQHSENGAGTLNPNLTSGGGLVRNRSRSGISNQCNLEAGQIIDVVNNGGINVNRGAESPSEDELSFNRQAGPLDVPTIFHPDETGSFLNFNKMDNPSVRKKTRPLKLKKKLYEFYAAPITKYYCHSLAFAVFLFMYSYICLVKTPKTPSFPELYVVAVQICFGCEKLRTLLITEPAELSLNLLVWVGDTKWNVFDSLAIVAFLISFALRFEPGMIPYVHASYSTIICYWYIRSLRLIGVNKYFGPYVMMIGKMIENMIYFIVLLLVVLMAFGVSRQSILYPNEEPHFRLIRHVFYQPYFMLYGEVFAPDIDPECNPDCEDYGECGTTLDGTLLVPCNTGRWITPIIMTIYLLVANILLINLLIASFNTIYNKVSAISLQLFNFQRFAIVMEYEEKPILPAPFIIISHVHILCKYIYRQIKGTTTKFESGLKLFLSKFDMERLYDFEEEGIDGLIRMKEEEAMKNTEAKMKTLIEST